MLNLPVSTADLDSLCESVQAAHLDTTRAFLRELAIRIANAGDMLRFLPAELRAGSRDRYTRHIAYADPHGAFTVAFLIWRPGQFSPVHGHKTWCAYQVLQGNLVETHYRWDPADGAAEICSEISRRPGDIATATQGLRQVHRLGNAGPDVAVSLHIYGVDKADLCTGVNHVVPHLPLTSN
ncbi:cysteine dioxygenase family protein [Achromobacter xylosoxidans]|uniref:cysteine dioxygenase family protein n=2 Tax=Pseudomonadota TaxID=1224 RepID=UPI001F131141|nr:cysteine dioxygenase family protein [Achromobacter xylosoxidans]MCZ8438964.1 cysteine dioxygenase family protein [Achromobacter xylosoxidans]